MRTQFSAEAVKLPEAMLPLTDYITQKSIIPMQVVSDFKTVNNGTPTPIFVVKRVAKEDTMVNLASATVAFKTPPTINVKNTFEFSVNDDNYKLNPTLGTGEKTMSWDITRLPIIVNVAGAIANLTAAQIQEYFGADFSIASFYNRDLGQCAKKDDGTFVSYTFTSAGRPEEHPVDITAVKPSNVSGYVTKARVVKDCQSFRVVTSKGKVILDPYKINSEADLIVTYKVTMKQGAANQLTSCFPLLRAENGVLYNDTFVNKQPWENVPANSLKNPAGFAFGRTWKLMLYNEPTQKELTQDSDYIWNVNSMNDHLHVENFTSIRYEALPADSTKDGYIDKENGVIYYRADKKCIVQFVHSQAPLNNYFLKTYEYDFFIDLNTGEWSYESAYLNA